MDWDNISPLDYRYSDAETVKFLSEGAFIRCQLMVEYVFAKTLIRTLVTNSKQGQQTTKEIHDACNQISVEEIKEEEKRIDHDIRAMVNCIQARMSDKAKPFVHLAATSFDIRDTATAVVFREATEALLAPRLILLEKTLIEIAFRERHTLQIGRTHGQHAIPITFGFAIAEYVSRLGESIYMLKEYAGRLRGKFSGAAGAYNALSLLVDDPRMVEKEALAELGLEAGDHATQIVHPEPLTRFFCECINVAGIMANLADDMRHLQRTEIREVEETFGDEQYGSSTMVHKRNPRGFENIKSLWKAVMPRTITLYMDQISEHQRDLTNSASARTYAEIPSYVAEMAKRLTDIMQGLRVNRDRMAKNAAMEGVLIAGEPLYILLAASGHPHAYTKAKEVVERAHRENETIAEAFQHDPLLVRYNALLVEKFSLDTLNAFFNPCRAYQGKSASIAEEVAKRWAERLHLDVDFSELEKRTQ